MTALLTPTDHSIVLTPCYQSLASLPKCRGAVTQVSLLAADHWSCDLEALRAAIRPNTKLLVMNWPHNPTGQVPTQQKWADLISLAREHGLWVFSDEVYRGLETHESLRLPPLATMYERGLSLGVVSKSIGLAGLRVGWVAGQDQRALNAIADVKHYMSICNSAPSEVLALIALRNYQVLLDRALGIVGANLVLLDSFMRRWSGVFRWVRPAGGCCGFVELLDCSAVGMDELARQLAEDHGVLILPGSVFNSLGGVEGAPATTGRVDNFFRIGFGRTNFSECLSAFERAVQVILNVERGV